MEEKDKEIQQLQEKLQEAMADIEANAALMEDVRAEMGKSELAPFISLENKFKLVLISRDIEWAF